MASTLVRLDYNELSASEAKELLQKWREDNTRNSESVRDIWLNLDMVKFLGDESKSWITTLDISKIIVNFI